MRRTRSVSVLPALLLAGVLAACGDGNEPGTDTRTTDQLSFIRVAGDAPPLCADSIAFTATRGQSAEAKLYYCAPGSLEPSDEFLVFKLGSNTLLRRPDGASFAEGDTVTISIKVVNATQFVFQFLPAGLVFNPNDPAELEVSYQYADDDLNDDGEVDVRDDDVEAQLAIWRQEQPGEPWVKIGTAVLEELDEVEARLTGFTRYAIAY